MHRRACATVGLSLDQVGVIAERAADGSDEHYAQLAAVATVTQLRTAIKLEPRPDPDPDPKPEIERALDHQDQSATVTPRGRSAYPGWRPPQFDAALQCHRDGLVADWKHDHPSTDDTDPDDTRPQRGGPRARLDLLRRPR